MLFIALLEGAVLERDELSEAVTLVGGDAMGARLPLALRAAKLLRSDDELEDGSAATQVEAVAVYACGLIAAGLTAFHAKPRCDAAGTLEYTSAHDHLERAPLVTRAATASTTDKSTRRRSTLFESISSACRNPRASDHFERLGERRAKSIGSIPALDCQRMRLKGAADAICTVSELHATVAAYLGADCGSPADAATSTPVATLLQLAMGLSPLTLTTDATSHLQRAQELTAEADNFPMHRFVHVLVRARSQAPHGNEASNVSEASLGRLGALSAAA